ncbi:hypothetical protein [Azospirillum argentinense]
MPLNSSPGSPPPLEVRDWRPEVRTAGLFGRYRSRPRSVAVSFRRLKPPQPGPQAGSRSSRRAPRARPMS